MSKHIRSGGPIVVVVVAFMALVGWTAVAHADVTTDNDSQNVIINIERVAGLYVEVENDIEVRFEFGATDFSLDDGTTPARHNSATTLWYLTNQDNQKITASLDQEFEGITLKVHVSPSDNGFGQCGRALATNADNAVELGLAGGDIITGVSRAACNANVTFGAQATLEAEAGEHTATVNWTLTAI